MNSIKFYRNKFHCHRQPHCITPTHPVLLIMIRNVALDNDQNTSSNTPLKTHTHRFRPSSAQRTFRALLYCHYGHNLSFISWDDYTELHSKPTIVSRPGSQPASHCTAGHSLFSILVRLDSLGLAPNSNFSQPERRRSIVSGLVDDLSAQHTHTVGRLLRNNRNYL